MLYSLLYSLKEHFFGFNVFRYITVRAALAGITAFAITIILTLQTFSKSNKSLPELKQKTKSLLPPRKIPCD